MAIKSVLHDHSRIGFFVWTTRGGGGGGGEGEGWDSVIPNLHCFSFISGK